MTLTDLRARERSHPGRRRVARASCPRLSRAGHDRQRSGDRGSEALKLDPHRADVAETVARAYASQGKQDEAIATLSATIDRATASLDALALLANLALEAKRYPAAGAWPSSAPSATRSMPTGSPGSPSSTARPDRRRSSRRCSGARRSRTRTTRRSAWSWPGSRRSKENPAAAGALGARRRSGSTSPIPTRTRSARSLTAEKHPADAVEEWAAAVSLKPDRLEWRFAEAEACVAAGRKDDARRVLDDLIARNAAYPGAKGCGGRWGSEESPSILGPGHQEPERDVDQDAGEGHVSGSRPRRRGFAPWSPTSRAIPRCRRRRRRSACCASAGASVPPSRSELLARRMPYHAARGSIMTVSGVRGDVPEVTT